MRQEKYLVFLSIQHLDLIIYHYYIGRHITAPRIQKGTLEYIETQASHMNVATQRI